MSQTKEQMEQEYATLKAKSLTVGERYSAEGQAHLDREYELLCTLAKLEGVTPYEYFKILEQKHRSL